MLSDRYRDAIARSDGKLRFDPAQAAALVEFERIRVALSAGRRTPARAGLWGRLRAGFGAGGAGHPVPGLYLWGGVGRGKTYLMDMFFESLPFADKRRYHYHRFMQMAHDELKTLREQQRPLDKVAGRLAEQTRIICLDEFFVADITDAMLLGGLLQALFERAVTLVTTSNTAPDDLYRDGLQRARFLPAIELLKTHTAVMRMDGDTDYRLRSLRRAELYCWPLGRAAEARLETIFVDLGGEPDRGGAAPVLEIAGRGIPARHLATGVCWFDFDALCDGPRSQTDYIEIARLFHTVLVSGLPVLDQRMEDQARRFLSLVDEFYDRNVILALSAAAPIDEIYQGRKLRFEYRRTRSRLQEMQSYEYLSRQHLP